MNKIAAVAAVLSLLATDAVAGPQPGPGAMHHQAASVIGGAKVASGHLRDESPGIITRALGFTSSGISSGLSSASSLVNSLLFFAAEVEADPDARQGKNVILEIAADNKETGNPKGSAGWYGRSAGFTEQELIDLGL